MKIKLITLLAVFSVLAAGALDTAKLQTNCPACDELGWQLAITPYSFRLYPISEAIDKTAGLGIKYIGLSGNIYLDNKTTVKVTDLTDDQLQSIRKKCDAAGIQIINIGIVALPPNEAQSRKVFEFAKKLGVDTIVAEPGPAALDTVEKLCKEYNIKGAIHDHQIGRASCRE